MFGVLRRGIDGAESMRLKGVEDCDDNEDGLLGSVGGRSALEWLDSFREDLRSLLFWRVFRVFRLEQCDLGMDGGVSAGGGGIGREGVVSETEPSTTLLFFRSR